MCGTSILGPEALDRLQLAHSFSESLCKVFHKSTSTYRIPSNVETINLKIETRGKERTHLGRGQWGSFGKQQAAFTRIQLQPSKITAKDP
jgi:hypothetical protein